MKTKWTKVDEPTAAERLTAATFNPGFVYPLNASDLPAGFRRMPGADSYFVSAYTTPIPATPGVAAAGEMVILRRDDKVTKAYNFVFATSGEGGVYYTGPFKDFDLHHMESTRGVSVTDLFGHSPWTRTP